MENGTYATNGTDGEKCFGAYLNCFLGKKVNKGKLYFLFEDKRKIRIIFI